MTGVMTRVKFPVEIFLDPPTPRHRLSIFSRVKDEAEPRRRASTVHVGSMFVT